MRICIDARVLCGPMTGIGRYTLNLINAFAKVDGKDNQYYLALAGDVPATLPTDGSFIPIQINKRIPLPFMGSQVYLPRRLRELEIDVFHCPQNWQYPFLKPCKYVITVHDLFPFLTPWKGRSVQDFLYHKFYRSSVSAIPKKADAVIVDSLYSKDEVMRWLHVPMDRIKVIPMAVDKIFKRSRRTEAIQAVREKYRFSDSFLLHVGADERKNSFSVVRAYAKACSLSGSVMSRHKLVMVGKLGRHYQELQKLVGETGLTGRVIFTGPVSDEDLAMLYQCAEALVYPCLQGPGLPPLEAMTCGTPAIVSKSPPLLEMVGKAAFAVDPQNEDEIARAIATLASDGRLRNKLRQKGIERAGMFSWERVARETLDTYKAVHEIGKT